MGDAIGGSTSGCFRPGVLDVLDRSPSTVLSPALDSALRWHSRLAATGTTSRRIGAPFWGFANRSSVHPIIRLTSAPAAACAFSALALTSTPHIRPHPRLAAVCAVLAALVYSAT